MLPSCVHGNHWIREMKGEGDFQKLLFNSHFENSLPFFVVGSERRPKVHQNFLIFLETSTRSHHHNLGAFVRVIGSERIREMAGYGGRFETSALLRFLSSVSTQFSIYFQNHHYFLPDFNRSSLIVVVWLIWMYDFVLNCLVELEREGWASRVIV